MNGGQPTPENQVAHGHDLDGEAIWRRCGVAFHTRAYANRTRAINEFMKTLKWSIPT